MAEITVRPEKEAFREIIYDTYRWKILKDLRSQAAEIMEVLSKNNISSMVHGSLARGDVDKESDIDVFISQTIPSFQIEIALEDAGYKPILREIVQATPWQLIKAHFYISEKKVVSWPLISPKKAELEFYYFGGAATLPQLRNNVRVPGVDKRLIVILPIEKGHQEVPVLAYGEGKVAKLLNISLDAVKERVQVLTRRAEIGHTGIYIKRALGPDETYEDVFRKLIVKHPVIKKRIRETE